MNVFKPSLKRCIFLILLVTGCQQSSPETEHDKTAKEPSGHGEVVIKEEMARRIKIGEPFVTNIADQLNVPGQVKVHEQRMVRVGASITGRIIEIYVQLGDSVEAGEKLARIASPELTQAQLSFMRANSLATLADQAAKRAKLLFASDVISAAELQRRESEAQIARADLSAAKDQLRLLGIDNGAMLDLVKHGRILPSVEIRAPRSGIVIERNVAQGQVVQPSDLLFTLADLSIVWVIGDVPEQVAQFVKRGQNVEILVPALENSSFAGVIIAVADLVNPLTRTVTVWTEVDNPLRQLKPDMLATVHITEQAHEHLVIPEDAVVRESNRDHVFVEQTSGTYALVPVELGSAINYLRPVLSGVTVGQRIVVEGAFHLNNERKRAELE
ncbi:MAG: efflux RND transporter periplasmic adaptor subunit [Nitrosomonas sp.]|jgi:cobalt-zinc-cadmium efflux system membrane fusion protein|nr:efflux RND transporter periplasmic adaptor subunit [Nitrosomonas sp.]